MAAKTLVVPPRLIAALICRSLRFNGRYWTLWRVSHVLRARTFPHYVERLMVYLKLGSVRPGQVLAARVSLFEAGTDLMLATHVTDLSPPDNSGTTDGHFPLSDLTFPAAGLYDVQVDVEGVLLDTFSVIVEQK
ncbi:MAG: hypothetical protein IT462_10035 [Planctomycetes bacterium]|nr:hypothetical protein [Planctomycetota bacterium]